MDVRLDSEQRVFAKVAGALAAEVSSRWELGRDRAGSVRPIPSESDHQRMVDAGWFAVRLGEEAGGASGSCADVCVVAEQLGRHTVPAPALGTLIVLEQLRLHGVDPAMQQAIAAGEARIAPVLTADLRGFAGPADLAAGDGRPLLAVDAAGATAGILVGKTATAHDLGAALTGADLTREIAPLSSTEPLAEHALTHDNEDAHTADRATAFALAVVAADLLGVSGRALDAAVEHAKARHQFGVPIGSFQAVQHMLAECLVSVEAARSAVWYAAWAVDALPPEEALRAARTAKAFASQEAVRVTETTVQVLGGLGMTWESQAHVWQRRAHLDRRLFGDETVQYELLAQW